MVSRAGLRRTTSYDGHPLGVTSCSCSSSAAGCAGCRTARSGRP